MDTVVYQRGATMSEQGSRGGGDEVELNPQPIPPGRERLGGGAAQPGDEVELNPQPIPPGRERLGWRARLRRLFAGRRR
jgi:hypothetical protein